MADNQVVKKEDTAFGISNTASDLIILFAAVILVFIASYFFNVFTFLVNFFQKNPGALNSVDEIITALLVLSIGFAFISWRRMQELKKETAERIRLQAKMLEDYETKLEMEKVICQGLHYDLEQYRKLEKDVLAKRQEAKAQDKEGDINN